MPLHSGTRTRLLARVVVASIAASLVVSTMQLPGAPRNVAQAAGVATVDSYASFNGTSQYFTAAHNSAFDFTGNITFSAWIRPSSTCFMAARHCQIINKENSWQFVIVGGDLQYAFMSSGGTWDYRSTGVTAISGQWQHISFATNKSTNTITLFVNGKQLFTQTNSTNVPNPSKASTQALMIGSRENLSSQNFAGDIDEVRVYNTVRATEALAQVDMNTWGPADTTGLVLYYDFNEGTGTALNNTVTGAASATHMTAVGSPTWADVKTTTVSNNRTLVAFPRSYLTSAGGFTMPTGVTSLDYLVVAGGGGGMARHGGGGGAGGLLTSTNYTIPSGAVLGVAVGGGGKGNNALSTIAATNGAGSILSVGGTAVATAIGGGAGNTTGGSGGGSNYLSNYGNGTPGQGNRGGAGGAGDGSCTGTSSGWCGGGGGGAGAVGENADSGGNNRSGNGGVGLASALLTTSAATTLGIGQVVSSSVFFAGGGAGGIDAGGVAGTGGNGGGANGTVGSAGAVLNGTAATGGGGGGGGYSNAGGNSGGGSGGSGAILLSYASPCTVTTTTLEGGVTQVVLTNPGTEMSCTSSWTSPVGVTMVDAVIVGAGGGGGGGTSDVSGGAGGGGAGGQVKRLRSQAISASTSYSITVGVGGAGGAGSAQGTAASGVAGASSIAFTHTSSGGNAGTGSVYNGLQTTIGGDGGSTSTSAGVVQAGGANVWEGAGGGAGAGSPGLNGSDGTGGTSDGLGGNGGNGQLVQWFTGSCTSMFGGGGGGGGAGSTGTSGVGGPGGGGAAATFSTAAVAGSNNCGGGGGGGYEAASYRNGASGGTGVVMFRYNYSWSARVFATGTVTVSPKSATNMGLGTSQVQYFTNGEVVTAQLTSTNGNIGVTLSGSATVSAGTNNSTDVTVRGSQTDVNNTLNSATLTTHTQGPGQVTLRITAAAQDQTINGLTFKHSNGHYFANRNFGTGVTRSVGQASEDARNYVMGGRYAYLATISAAAENTFIVDSVRTSGTEAWIGLADDVLEGTFIWDGPDLVGAGRYSNWVSGEPNNSNAVEDYSHYSTTGLLNDQTAAKLVQYAILEIEPTKTKKIFNVNYSITGNTATTGKASRIETVGAGDPIAVNQFDKSETMTVTVSVTAGSTVSLTGITPTAGANGSASVTFEGTRDAVNTALSTLTMTPGSSGTSTITVSYRAKGVTVGNYKYNSTTDSFYLLDSTTRTYSAAVTNAEASTFAGVRGFLATVLSNDERLFIKNNVTSASTWVNGRDEAAGGDATVEGQWVVDGNDAYKSFSSESLAIDGGYAPWYTGEPSGGAEGCMTGNFITDFWNDATCSGTSTGVIEFKPYTVSYAIPVTVTDVGACTTTTTTSGKYTMQQVTPTGHCNWTVPTGVTTIDTFIQGAGGGGGSDAGTGGNGGTSAMVQGRAVAAGNTVNVYVGEGGTGAQWAQFDSLNGEDTFVTVGANTLTAAGGPGGNSGPGVANAAASAAGIGFSGGLGGTSAAFADGAVGGTGKTGSELLWSGTSVEYGGGGGGGAFNGGTFNLAPAAGASGGGAGCDANTATNTAGLPGLANRGGGGGSGCAGNGGRTQGGSGGSATVIFRYATDPLDAFPAVIGSLRAYMTADSFQKLDSTRRSWVDTSGNLDASLNPRHAATFIGSPSVTTVTGNGANETVRTLSGGTGDGLQFPTGFLSTAAASANDYTFFHIARYSGASKARIFDATNANWLSGFWGNNAGVAFHNNWISGNGAGGTYSHTNWVMSVDQPFAYRQNAGEVPSATTGTASRSDNLSINHGYYRPFGEISDWNVAEVIVFSRVLTAAEIRQVESYLVRKYGLTGVNTAGTATLPLTPKSLATNKNLITASDRLNITWAAPNDVTGITDYKLEYKKSADSTWLTKSHTLSTTYLSDTVTGLDADTQYDFRVSAVDSGASNRPATATVNGTTKKSSTVTLTAPASPRRSVAATISAAVTSSATGTVTFLADGSNITGCVNVAVSSSAASCSWTPAALGAVSLTATYGGDTTFAAATTASASSVTVTFGNCAPTVTVVGRFTVNRFLDSSSSCNYAALPTGVDSVDILVVGGGGGGGENVGSGGGGGGGYEANNVAATSANSFTVTVGAGGRAGSAGSALGGTVSADRDGGVGGNSSITWDSTTLTGTGGGAGQTAWSNDTCNGGGGWNTTRPAGGTGSGTGGTAGTGGQGGIGDQDGTSSGFAAQAGGNGFLSGITGINFGGGGGGGGYNTSGGAGGAGGGASGGTSTAGGAGTANTGGGGGGGFVGCVSGGAGGSGIVIMRYANVPTISGQPTARTVSAGTSTTFAVTAAATGATLSYQWQKDGVDISGATLASYTITSPVVSDAGNFRVVVRNFGTGAAVSSVTSNAVALAVNVASQNISFGTLSGKTYGDAAVSVSPSASSNLPVTTVSNDTSVCTISGSTVTIVGAGTCSLTASQAGDDSYTAATSATQTFIVSKKTLTLSGLVAANKIYDRATTATVDFPTYSFGSSIVGSDVVTLTSTSYLATFASVNVANDITVTVTGLSLGGAQAANYQLPSPITTLANITKRELTVTGVTANNKSYDGNTTATLVTTNAAVSGYISPDTATFTKSTSPGTFDSADVANDIVVRTTGFSISGGQSANYALTQPATQANITPRDLAVSGITASIKTYDDTNTATLVIGAIATNKVGSDAVTVETSSATGTFADKNKADGITVQVAGVSISGAKAGNYNLLQPTTTANISARPVTVTGITVTSKVYDQTNAASLGYELRSINNVAGDDVLTLSTGSVVSTFNNKTAASGKVVTVSGLAVSGAESANYSVTQPTYLTGEITAKAVTVLSLTATNKTYNGTRTAAFTGTATLGGVISGDSVSVSTSGATATFDTKDHGTSKAVAVVGVSLGGSDAGNYAVQQPTLSANIDKKNLTVSGLSGVNRTYDRTVAATFTGTASPVGKVGSENVTINTSSASATFANKTVADNKVVTLTGVTLSGSDAGNYTVSQPQLSANITTAALSVTGVTANDKVYNGNTTATLTDTSAVVSGVIGADDVTLVKTGSATFATATVGNAKSVTVTGYTIAGTDAGNYTLTQPTGLSANITEASAGLAWSAPSAITYGTLLSATQLNATASVPGTFVYTPALGTKLVAGTQTLSVTFTPTSSDYAAATTTVSITINKKALTITASSESLPYGSAVPTITASYSGFISGESSTALTAQPECSTVYTGLSTANTSQATSCTGATAANYAITETNGAVTVTKRSVTVTASSPSRAYGDAQGTITPSYSSDFQNSDTSSVVSSMSCGTGYTNTSAAGTTHSTFCNSGTATNYQFTYVNGSITVNKKTVAVTASSHSVDYGDAAPTVTPSYGPFANGDTSSVVSNMACTTSYSGTTPVASSGIATSCSAGTAANYQFTYTSGAITISKRALTVTASSHGVDYGDAAPSPTPSYSGWVNSQGVAALTTAPTCTTAYTSTTAVALSGIATSCSGGLAANYSFTFVAGAVTISKKSVAITASSPTVTYGDAIPAVTASYGPFVNGDSSSVVSNTSCSTVYVRTSNAGSAPATSCSGATAANYTFTYVSGAVNVEKKSVSVTASSHSVVYGDAKPTVTPAYDGFVNSQSATSFTTAPTCDTTYTTTSGFGTVASTCSGGSATNYSFSFTPGVISVAKKTLTVTASSHGVDYGDAAPSPTPSYDGWVNSQGVAALTTAPTCTTAYTSTTAVASSGIATSCSGGVAANYSFTFVAGAVSINKKSVATTASSPTVTYGDVIPVITPSYGTFVNGDTSSVVSNTACATAYVRTSNVGSLPATSCSSATADNYSFTYTSGAVVIEKKTVAVTASSHSVNYGDAAPTVTPSYGPFINGDTSSVVSNMACTTSFSGTTPVASSGIATSCSAGTAANYQFSYTPGAITISKRALTVTASSHTVTYGDAAPAPTPGYSGWVNSQGVSAITTAPTCTTAYSTTTSVALSGIATSCSGGLAANYTFTFITGVVNINAKNIAVTASSPTVNYGDAVPVVTPSYSGFVNSETSSVVSSTSCSTVYVRTLNVGSVPATSCSGATADNYSFSYTSGAVVIEKKTLTVTASSPSAAYGVAASTISVSPLYSNFANAETSSVIDTAPTCTTAYTNTSAVGSAPYTRCAGGTDNNYAFAFVDGAVQVGTATVTITAENKIATYGTALGQSVSVSGLANSDSVDSVSYTYAGTGATSYTSSTARPTAVGGYSITPSAVVLAAGSSTNYTFNYVAGTGTISKKPVVVAASSPTVIYGASSPTVTPIYSNDFAYGDASSVVSNTACSTVYTVTSNVGSAPATSCSGATAANYSFTYVDGAVNVQKKTLTVTASSPSAVYGVAANTISVGPLYSNFANAETSSVIDIAPTCTTAFTNTSDVGSAPYTRCSGGTDNNYVFSFVDGAVQVGVATVTITAENKNVIYGTALGQSVSVSGLANSDAVDSVVYSYAGTGATSYTASTTRPTVVGGYSITPSSVVLAVGALSNYTFNYVAGTGIINKKPVVVTASSPTVAYGDSTPTITPLYSSDFVYGDTSSVVSNTSCSTVYAVTSNVGSAPATSCTGATAANYSFTYVAGTVNVQKKTLTVTASSPSAVYGAAANTISVSPLYSNFAHSETSSVIDTAPTCSTVYTNTSAVASAPYTRCAGGSDNNYQFSFVDGAVQVGAATVTITAENKTATYGTALGQSVSVSGLANSDSVDSVSYTYAGTGATSYTASTTRPTVVGGYSITPSSVVLAVGALSNYTFNYVAGTGTINKKGITVTASSPIAIYGASSPTITPIYSSDFAYGETSSVVSNTSCTTVYAVTSNVGSAPATSCTGATAANYSFTYVDGAVNVAKKTVMVAASSHFVVYGDAKPTVTPSYDGFENSQSATAFTTAPTCDTAYTTTSGFGTVASTCSGGSAVNYSFSFTPGVISVAKKTLTVTAPSPTVTYGDTAPTLTATITGWVNSETSTVLTTVPTCGTTYTNTSNANTAPSVTCVGAVDDNYAFTYVSGAFTINKAAQDTVTVSATDAQLTWQPGPSFATTTLVGADGDGDGSFTYSVTSTNSVCSISGDTLTALTAGECKLTATKGTSTNYLAKTSSEFSYTIAKAAQTITFAALAGKTYGESSFTISLSASSGLVVGLSATTGACSVGASSLSGGTTTATVSIVAAGSCTVTASQSGNLNYNSATAAPGSAMTRTFTIARKALTIQGATAANKVYDTSDAATGDLSDALLVGVMFSDDVDIAQSGFTATFSNANAANTKTVSFAGVTLQGAKAANYSVAQPTTTANITQASAGLNWATPTAITYGATLSATQLNAGASVGGTYTYTPSLGTLLEAGTRTLSVTFTPTSTNFAIATTTVTLVVNQKAVTVTAANQSVVYGNSFTPAFSTTAFVGSDAASAVTYTYSGTGGTAYSASSTAPTIRGSYLITPSALALSVGNLANYDMTYVDGTLGISQAEQGALVVTASSQSLTYSPNPSPATATLSTLLGSAGSGTGAVSYAVASGNTVCSISSSTLTALTAGTCSVTVTRDADINFVAKTSDAITITIAKATQTLSFASISDKTYGDANFSVTPTASSGLTVSLSTATAQVCDIPSALTIRIVNVGSCTVIATQSGNINYEEATAAVGSSTTRSFSVARKTLTVSGVTTVSRIYDGSTDATEQLQFSSAQLNGVVSGDTVSLNSAGASGSYASKSVDTNKAITISGLALQGTHAARYNVQSPSDVSGTVLQATVSTTGITVVTRAFNGTRTATISTMNHALSGVLGSDAVVLDNTNYSALYDTATAAVSKSVTVSALALSGADAANYTLVQPMLLGAMSKALATVSFSSPLDVVYDASPRTVSTSTSPSSLNVVTQYSGRSTTTYLTSTTGPTDAGNYTVAATINETNYLGSNSADFFVGKQLVPVALDTAALNTSFTGRARYVSASTTPSGKQVVVTYQGSGGTTYAASTYAPTNAGSYVVTATIDERNFQGTLVQTLSVAKASQAPLVIVNTSTVVYGDSSTVLLAKGGTGNGAITYAKVSGPCSVDATTGALTTTGIGSCVVRATKSAGDNVEATTSANKTLDIVKAPQNIAFISSPPSSPVSSETYTPTATSSAGLAVSLVITVGEGTACNRSGSTVTFVGSGVCEVTASQAGSSLYEAATSVVQRIEVGKINQAITFPQPSRKRITDPTFMLEASASSGLTVTYALTSGSSICSLDANGTVSLLAVGTCAVTASQVGDASVSAANPITRVITVVADVPSAPKITSISGGDAMVTVGYLPPAFDGGSAILGYRLKVQASSLPAVTSSQCDLVARTCAISGLTNGTEYVVSLSAVNAAGAGEENEAPGFSNPAPVLEAVRNVAGQRNDATMNVTWEDPESFGDGTFDRYELSIREDGGSFNSPVTVQSVRRLPLSALLPNIVAPDRVFVNTASTRQHTFTGLDNTKTYFVKIVTITSTAVVSRGSNTAAATLLPLEAPSAPLDVVVESSTGRSATVSWKAPVTNGGSPLIRYTVSASQGSCVLATLLATKCEIAGLNPGQSFSVGVRAVNAVGQSSATTESIVLPDTPSAPRVSGVSLTGVSALVTWTAPASNGGRFITSYAVSAVNASNATDITRCTTTALTCTINSLKMGVTYNFSVRARNSVGEGAASALFTTMTAAPVVAPPVSSGAGTTVWETYRAETAGLSRALVGMPPAPGKVRIASTGARTKVTATGTKTSGGPITHAIITISSKARKVLARISVRVSSDNPTATVTVPFKSTLISVSVQFANDYGVSTGGLVGVNVREGNTYDSTVVGGRPQLMGSINGDPVYFAAGSSALTPAGMKQLRAVATRVKMTSGLVYVTGYSRIDEVRGWAVDALARARAETVAKYLAKMGVRQWIRFQGAGAVKSDWGDWRDRRVVVYDGGNLGTA